MNDSATRCPRLLLTITGIRRDTVPGAEIIRDSLRDLGVRAGVVVTPQAPGWRLHDDVAALEFVHDCLARRHEILLGGMGLKDMRAAAAKGEFHRLGEHEARLRLTGAKRQLTALGLHPEVFAPEKWLASGEAMSAAAQLGLQAAADAYKIRDLRGGAGYDLRVLAFGDGFGASRWWRKNVMRTAKRMVERGSDIRLSVNAGKGERKNTLEDLRQIVAELVHRGYEPQPYSDYVGARRLAIA